jgi:hypothetical protein
MSKCEFPGCEDETVCFHYCKKHHEEICMDGRIMSELRERSEIKKDNSVAEYIIVTNDYLGNFRNEVNKMMTEGYALVGGVSHCVWYAPSLGETREEWSQAMVIVREK